MKRSFSRHIATFSGVGIFFLPTPVFSLENKSAENLNDESPTTLAQTGIDPRTGRPISPTKPTNRESNNRLPGVRLPARVTLGRGPKVVIPNASKLDNFSRLNPQLGLSQRYRFNSLSSFKSSARRIRQLKLGDATLNLSTYANSRNSLPSFSSRITPYVVPGSLSGKARLLSNSNNRVAIIETISYQPKFSTCSNKKQLLRPSTLSVAPRKTSPLQRAAAELCFSRLAKKSVRNQGSSVAKSKIQLLKVELNKAANNKPARLPAWARGLSSNQLKSLSRYQDKQLSQVIANNARITRVRTIIGEKPALSKARALQLRSAPCKAGACDFASLTRSQNGSTRAVNAQKPRVTDGTYKVDEQIYLTGFTFADSFYWTEVWEATLDYGLDTASVVIAPYAEAYYGFGARFPLKVKTDLKVTNNARNAELAFNVRPIEANAAEFTATGLPPSYIFGGKELVAEVGATAGLTYLLPVVGLGELGPYKARLDFTSKFPDPLTGGNFIPPSSRPVRLGSPVIFDSVDLLLGSGNYYVDDVGGASFVVNPGISVGLRSPDRGISVVDMKNSNRKTKITSSRRKATIKLDGNQNAKFKIKDPYYRLALSIYPGIQLKGDIGILGWNQPVKKYIDFPSLGIDIPSGGIPFGCHAGTICSRTYSFKAGTVTRREEPRAALYNHTIRLSKNYRIRDDEYFSDEFYNRAVTEQPKTVQRPRPGRGPVDATVKRHSQRNRPLRCAGGEVRGEDWDRIEVDSNGVAKMWISIDLYEGTSCSNQDKDGSSRRVTPEGAKIGNAFLVVPPGGVKTKELRVNNTAEGGDYVRIKYTLKNEVRRVN